ncbi:MAG: aspartate aminotransferase family protein, partial [Nitrososphaerota archaeon]|nr:aspartate aminotransferase family protein [Nitrososphaerota archaeon]
GLFFAPGRVGDFAGAKRTDRARFAEFHRAMLEEGVYLPPSPFETLFVSTAHAEADVDKTAAAARRAFQRLGKKGSR